MLEVFMYSGSMSYLQRVGNTHTVVTDSMLSLWV
jgi:hypothetical protein